MPGWRRIADWKDSVVLVEHSALPPGSRAERDWIALRDRLRDRAPALAGAVERLGFVRVEADDVAELHAAGVHTVEVGYHRGVDFLSYAEDGPGGRAEVELEAIAIAAAVDEEDAPVDDVVDALLRIHSEGLVTEAAVLLAAALPGLGEDGEVPELDPSTLPAVTEPFVDRVAEALAAERSRPPTGVWPDLTVAQRRAGQKQGAVMILVGLAVMGIGALWTPMMVALGAPILVLGAVVIAVHEAALRQRR